MGEGLKQMFYRISVHRAEDTKELFGSISISSESDNDTVFSCSSDLSEDEAFTSSTASSASSSSTQIESNGPLYELSPLMAQLPIKRGLSRYYQGKSQSFTSLFNARRIEDLSKETPFRRNMKTSKSYSGGMEGSQKQSYAPGPVSKTISKKARRGSSCASLAAGNSSSSNLLCSRKPPKPAHKSL